ncbi:ubiquitinyl hydrolase 1 [Ranunculus cassubicifolius]
MKVQKEVTIYSIANKVKHGGHVFLSSVSQNHFVAAILGFTTLIYAIRQHKIASLVVGEENSLTSRKRLGIIAGLQNMGNNCFLNVTLQALASCPSFWEFIQSVIEEDGFSKEEMPLVDALADLFKDLCTLQQSRVVLSPRKVMLVIDDYIPDFNLTMQQDAAEAFVHIWSSIGEELLDSFVPHCCSLVDVSTLQHSRICSPLLGQHRERQRWQKHLLGPFNGTLCSSLSCKSCSSQLSAKYEFFDSLSLSPLLDDSRTILYGCSIEICLRKFTAPERVDGYRCSHCWHNSAIQYLSTIDGTETQIEKLKSCPKEDFCSCKNLFPEKAELWSNKFSYTVKQLHVARCPKILCIQLKRSSVDTFGEPVKLQGHISFPLILDLFPFTKEAAGGGIDKLNERFRVMKIAAQQNQRPNPRLNYLRTGFTESSSSCEEVASNSYIYQLTSVVVHFGIVGSGHYKVYRRGMVEESGGLQCSGWFSASDSDVYMVSEREVLDADASLLFYEKIETSKQSQNQRD